MCTDVDTNLCAGTLTYDLLSQHMHRIYTTSTRRYLWRNTVSGELRLGSGYVVWVPAMTWLHISTILLALLVQMRDMMEQPHQRAKPHCIQVQRP